MPAWSAIKKAGMNGSLADVKISHGGAATIWMTKAHHKRTQSHGTQGSPARAYRDNQTNLLKQGKYCAAVKLDVADVLKIHPKNYNDSIVAYHAYNSLVLGYYCK